MNNFQSHIIPAWQLLADDYFRMGGTLYRITKIDTSYIDALWQMNVSFMEETGDPNITMSMTVPRSTPFKVYRKK